jgi:hypothetical protein
MNAAELWGKFITPLIFIGLSWIFSVVNIYFFNDDNYEKAKFIASIARHLLSIGFGALIGTLIFMSNHLG